MPRVPVLEGRSVLPGEPYPSLGPAQVEPDQSAARMWGSVAQAVGQAGAGVERLMAADERATREAEAVAEADSMLAFDGRAQRRQAEFAKLRGLAASEARADVAKGLDDDRQELAGALKTPRARNRFLQRSAESLAAYRRQAEAHAGREFEAAREATVKARVGQALGMAEAGVPDFESWLILQRQVEADIRANTRSEDGGAGEVAAFRAESGKKLVEGLLAQGRVGEAEKYVEDNRATLAGQYVEAKAAVARELAGAKEDAGDLVQQGLVDSAAEAVRTPDGYVTEAALRAQFPVEQLEPGARKATELAIRERVRLEEAKLADDVKERRNEAEQDVGAHRPIRSAVRDFLHQYDARYLRGLDEHVDARWKQLKKEKEGTAREQAEARREQERVDREAANLYAAELVRNPGKDPLEFAREFAADKAASGRSVGISDVGLSALVKAQAGASKSADTKESAERRRALADLERTLRGAMKGKGGKVDERLLQERVGKAAAEYDRRVEAGGKPLDAKQLAELEAASLQPVVVEPGWLGTSIGQKKGLAVDLPGGVPGPDAGVRAPAPAPGGDAGVAAPDELVSVISTKTGKPGKVPRSRLDAALKAGAVRLP